jgi:hypothetical protein
MPPRRNLDHPTHRRGGGVGGSHRRGRSVLAAIVVGSALVLSGCQTGLRPTVTEERKSDPSVQAVTSLLDQARTNGDFTATYDITPTMIGSATAPATVTVIGNAIAIAIRDVLYVIEDGVGQTCALDRTNCTEGIDDARVSDLSITHAFWADSASARLRNDAGRTIGTPQPLPDRIADQPATCVDVPVAGGSIVYCALDAGPLARYRGADTTIELTSFTPGGVTSVGTGPGA